MRKLLLSSLAAGLGLAPTVLAQITVDTNLGALATPSTINLSGDTTGANRNVDFYPGIGLNFNESLGEFVVAFSIGTPSTISITNNEGGGTDHDHFLLDGLGVTLDGGSGLNHADRALAGVDEQGTLGAFPAGIYYLSIDTYAGGGNVEGPYDIDLVIIPAPYIAESAPFLADSRNYEQSTPPFTANTVAPDVVVNTGIGNAGGTSFTITMAMLQVTGGPSGTDAITFTLLSAPVHGTLRLNGSPLSAGAMFTQADIDGGLLVYERAAGTALTDTFELGAKDENSNALLEGGFHFAVSGLPGASGMLFVADSRSTANSTTHTVHSDNVARVVADTVPGSLRQAISNTAPSGTTILDAALNGNTIALNSGPLVVNKALTIDNSATPGGLTLSGNQDSAILHLTSSGVLTLDGMTLTDGKSTVSGGAIVNEGDLTLTNVTVVNSLSFLDGGGIFNSGTLSLSNATIAGNLAADSGGGIFNAGTLTAIHATISDNEAFFLAGGGIYTGAGTVALENSVVAGNVAAVDDNLNGPPDTATGNNLTSGDPRLAPLGDYGGRTPTMPPLPGSPLIEGAVLLASTPPTDQLGNPRPSGPQPDLGAVEAVAVAAALAGAPDSEPDGIPDVLEAAYPQFTVGVDDSALDSDGDGTTDAEEIADMTDPLDSSDYFRIMSFGPTPTFDAQTNPLVTVTVSTFPGLSYAFETDASLQNFQQLPGSAFTADDFTATFEILLGSGGDFVRGRRN